MGSKARQQLFTLLGEAPSDTAYSLTQFLLTKICDRLNVSLEEVGDKALAKHLNALINGPVELRSNRTSPRARKAAQASPISGELQPWGIGDASRRGEWPRAVVAVKRLSDLRQWPLGKTLAYLADLLQTWPSNRQLTDVVAWMLDGELSAELSEYSRHHKLMSCLVKERASYI